MIIIGFGYKKRTGKDTAVRFALSFARQNFPTIPTGTISFGDQLKRVSLTMFAWAGLREGDFYAAHPEYIDQILPPCGLSPRQIWDKVGLMGRDIYSKVWIEMAALDIEPEAEVLFSKDIRFPTEIELIERFHGYKYRIDRKEAPKGGKVDEALDDYDGWDGIIHNHGDSLRDFNRVIKILTCRHLNPMVDDSKLICPKCFACNRAIVIRNENGIRVCECGHCQEDYSVSAN